MDGFSHFPVETLDFLTALKANNNRAWFAENKPVYESALKLPGEEFSHAMALALKKLTGLPHRARIFRIHRDVRFSKDKTPYNAHLHISFMPEAEPVLHPGWYFGLETDRLLAGTGVFQLEKAGLDAFRTRVASDDGEGLAALLEDLSESGVRINEPELKRVPPPYPADHPRAELLRRKSLTAWMDFDDPRSACEAGFADRCLETFSRLKPVFDWLAVSD